MNNKLTYFLLFVFIVAGCEKISNDRISGTLKDRYTGEPLEGVPIVFDIGGRGYGVLYSEEHVENMKYYTVTDSDGSFFIKGLGLDVKYKFYANIIRPETFDSTEITWRYIYKGSSADSLWIKKGIHENIKLRPRVETKFIHPKEENDNYEIDSIFINVYNQAGFVTKEKRISKQFWLLPSKEHTIKFTYIENGTSTTKTIKYYISADHIRHRINIPE